MKLKELINKGELNFKLSFEEPQKVKISLFCCYWDELDREYLNDALNECNIYGSCWDEYSLEHTFFVNTNDVYMEYHYNEKMNKLSVDFQNVMTILKKYDTTDSINKFILFLDKELELAKVFVDNLKLDKNHKYILFEILDNLNRKI